MRIVSLNTWGGRAGKEGLLNFFKAQSDVDVFCLQEVWSAPYEDLEGHVAGGKKIDHSEIMVYGFQEIAEALPDHDAFFRPHLRENYGLSMLVKKSCAVIEEGEIFVHQYKGYEPEGDVGNHARNIQHITIAGDRELVTVINFHGLWNGQGKGDSEDRFLQSANIVSFLATLKNPHLICGDYNLRIDTESLKKLEDAGLRNLIREYGITSTRTSFYTKPEKHADYALVSQGINVHDFKVLPDEVSDQAPLYLEIV